MPSCQLGAPLVIEWEWSNETKPLFDFITRAIALRIDLDSLCRR
jgi:hypothetical protein